MGSNRVVSRGLVAVLVSSACMVGPADGEIVASRASSMSFWGLYPAQGASVRVEARSTADNAFHQVAATTSNGLQLELFDIQWWMWSVNAVLPNGYWRAGVTGHRAEIRGFADGSVLTTYPRDGLDCMLDEEAAGTSATEAQGICASTNTPQSFVYTADYKGLPEFVASAPLDYPQELEHGETSEIQGVATTATHWFFANNAGTPGLVRIPIGSDLDASSSWNGALVTNMPASISNLGYDHYGDLDEFAGRLFVPIEHGDGGLGLIAQFDTNHNLLGSATLDGPKAPWVAIDPGTGRLYTSAFDDVAEMEVYTMVLDGAGHLVDLQLFARRPLWNATSRLTLQRIQGGAFSPNGNLYLVSDNFFGGEVPAGEPEGGVYGFKGDSMRLETHFPIAYTDDNDEELEGIEVRNIAGGVSPGVSGQLHVVMLDNDWDDDLYFKHFRLANAAQLGFL